MNIPNGFLLRILKSVPVSDKETGEMSIIVLRPYDYLISELQSVFKGQEDVEVKVDSRYEERRTKKEPFSHERRWTDRRRSKEALVEVVIST